MELFETKDNWTRAVIIGLLFILLVDTGLIIWAVIHLFM